MLMCVEGGWDFAWHVGLQTTTWNIVLGEHVRVPLTRKIGVPLQNLNGLQALIYLVPERLGLGEIHLPRRLNYDKTIQNILQIT